MSETTEKKPTAKAKESLAETLGLSVAEMAARRVMWVPFALAPEDSEMLALVAKAREQKVFVAPAQALAAWLEENRGALEVEAQEVRVADEQKGLRFRAGELIEQIAHLLLQLSQPCLQRRQSAVSGVNAAS